MSIDTTQAQKDLKLIDKQIDELGNAKPVKVEGYTESIHDLIESQKKFVDSVNSYVNYSTKSTQKLISKLERVANQVDKSLKHDSEDIYKKKLQDLENQKKLLETQLKPPSNHNSTGRSTTSSSDAGRSTSNNNIPPNRIPPNSVANAASVASNTGGSNVPSPVSDSGGALSKMLSVLVSGGSILRYLSNGAKDERALKSQAYDTYNRTEIYGSDFSKSRANSHSIGIGYGYDASSTMNFQGSLMSRAGFTNQDNLNKDTQSLMSVSKAYGMNLNRVGYVAGKYSQTGTIQSGDQSKFANLLATSIKEVGMVGREDEQLDVLDQINGNLEKSLVNVTGEGVTSALGLYSTLAQNNQNLKGQRGADMVSTINSGITNGGSSIDMLLGWGTKYKGVEGRWALEEAKAKGISDPDNLKTIISTFESSTGQSITSASGKLMLKNQFNLTPEEVNELIKSVGEIKSGSYGKSLASSLNDEVGSSDIDQKLKLYSESEVATEGKYDINKRNAAASIGDSVNTAEDVYKNMFNGYSTGHQSALGLGGALLQGWGTGKAVKWGWNKLRGRASNTGTAAGVAEAATGATGAADAASGLDDVARAAAGGTDDVVTNAARASQGLAKAGKALGLIGIAAEVIASGVDIKSALDKGDKKGAAAQAGGGIGSILGGIGGGIALGAAVGSVVPIAGTAVGAVVGGVGGIVGALAGNALGEAAGSGIYDLVNPEDDKPDGSHATGNAYIPYDGYHAITHKGEAILSAHDANQWRSGKSNSPMSASLEQQNKAFGQITEINRDTVKTYAKLIDKESDLVDRREQLSEKDMYSASSSGVDTLLSNSSPYARGVTSNNLKESKNTSMLSKIAGLFGLSTAGSGSVYTGGSHTNPTISQTPSGDGLASYVADIIHGNEGGYTSINYDDNGALSLGKIQWHAGRAKDLLNQIKSADTSGFNSIVNQFGAQSLSSSMASNAGWGDYTLSKGSAEAKAIQALLGSEVGKQVQDSIMTSDTQGYLNKGKELGLSDTKALAFYADLANQYGMYSDIVNKTVVPQAISNGGSLSAIYQSAVTNLPNYQSRRTSTFNTLSGTDFSQFQDKAIGMDRIPYDGFKINGHKDETLLTADESKDYREKKGIFSSLLNPLQQLNKTASSGYSPEVSASSNSQSFSGELKVTLGGSVEGMTPENQNKVVAAVLQRLNVNTGNSVLNNLSNSLIRVPH